EPALGGIGALRGARDGVVAELAATLAIIGLAEDFQARALGVPRHDGAEPFRIHPGGNLLVGTVGEPPVRVVAAPCGVAAPDARPGVDGPLVQLCNPQPPTPAPGIFLAVDDQRPG